MSCAGYTPVFGVGQLDGSPYAGFNCNTWSAGKAADYDSCGHQKPSSATIRVWTHDISGGTTLAEVDDALRVHTGIDLDTRYRLPWDTFVHYLNSGRGAILQGGYAPIADSKFDAGNGFRKNHSIWVPPSWAVEDPLADGRYPNVYKYRGEVYPQALLKSFAGHLNLEGRAGYPARLLGSGLVYAAFTRDNEPAFTASIQPQAGTRGYPTYRYFGVYTVTNGVITASRVSRTGGFTATATAPRLYHWAGHTSQSLVQLTSGSRKGQFIRSVHAEEV